MFKTKMRYTLPIRECRGLVTSETSMRCTHSPKEECLSRLKRKCYTLPKQEFRGVVTSDTSARCSLSKQECCSPTKRECSIHSETKVSNNSNVQNEYAVHTPKKECF